MNFSLKFQNFFSITIYNNFSHSRSEQFWKQSTYCHFFQVSKPFRYKNKKIKHGEGLLSIEQARLPFDIGFESLKPFNVLSEFNYSSTGDRLTTCFHQFSQFFSPIVEKENRFLIGLKRFFLSVLGIWKNQHKYDVHM